MLRTERRRARRDRPRRRASTREVGPRRASRSTRRRRRRLRHTADGHLHLRHHRPAEGHQQQPHQAARRSAWRCRATSASAPTTSATPACRSSTRTRCSSASCRRSRSAAALALRERFSATQLRARRAPLRRDVLELRRRAGALRAGRDREAVRRRRGAHPRRGHQQPEEPLRYAVGNGAAPPDIDRFMRLARARGHVRALRLDRGGDQHLPQEGRSARQRRRDHRRRA